MLFAGISLYSSEMNPRPLGTCVTLCCREHWIAVLPTGPFFLGLSFCHSQVCPSAADHAPGVLWSDCHKESGENIGVIPHALNFSFEVFYLDLRKRDNGSNQNVVD